MVYSTIVGLLCFILLTGCAQQRPIKQTELTQSDQQHTVPQLQTLIKASLQTPVIAVHEPTTQLGRYSVITATPTPAQEDIMTVLVTIKMPGLIHTVGDAIQHLLQPSGYRLARFDAQGPEVIQLLNLPLPDVHRHLGPMPLNEALLVLASPAFILHTDPVHRLIAYDLKPDYKVELVP